MNLENKIREALQRQEPPASFAERVILQAKVRPESGPRPLFRLLWPAVSVATTALVLSISVEYRAAYREREQRAGQQAIQALRIASEELNSARDRILNQ